MADISGSGAIQHIWMTPTGDWRNQVLRIYWDDDPQPAVECPLGDFFALGWGEYAPDLVARRVRQPGQRVQLLLGDAVPHAGPHHAGPTRAPSSARSTTRSTTRSCDVPDDAAYFCAQFRRVNPLPEGRGRHDPRRRAAGAGHYVGTYLRLGRQQRRLVGRGRDQVLHRRRRRVPDDLRHRHRGLLLRLVQLRRRRPVHRVHARRTRACRRCCAPTARTARSSASACTAGTSPTRSASDGPARDDAGARLAARAGATCRCRTTSPPSRTGTRPCHWRRSRRCPTARPARSSDPRPVCFRLPVGTSDADRTGEESCEIDFSSVSTVEPCR